MPVNYDELAARFDERYQYQSFPGIRARLRRLAIASRPGARVLEVGCGTGHWLAVLGDFPVELLGVDPSFAMLRTASARPAKTNLVCASADFLPFRPQCLDLVFCVNAFHHFSKPEKFLRDTRQLLRTSGRLAIFGLDPHAANTAWYIYDYFSGVRVLDRRRYLAHDQLKRLLREAGFRDVITEPAEHIRRIFVGETVLGDPFLERSSTSQLLLISEQDYRNGRQALCSTIEQGERRGVSAEFPVNLTLFGTVGQV